MKRKPNYILREVAGENIVIPVDEAAINFNGIMTLNSTGKFLWNLLGESTTPTELIARLEESYDVDMETATRDVTDFLAKLRHNKILEDE